MTSKGHKILLLSLYLQIALKDIFLDEIFQIFLMQNFLRNSRDLYIYIIDIPLSRSLFLSGAVHNTSLAPHILHIRSTDNEPYKKNESEIFEQ